MERTTDLSAWVTRLATYQYLAELVSGRDVLEVGCNAGVGTRYLARLGARRVVGIEADETLVAGARAARSLANVEFRQATPDSIDADDSVFDLVVVADGERTLRRRSVLHELRRVLRPGGALVVCTASADRPGARGGASYFDVFERLAARFSPVRMFALSPFVGASLVAYDETRPRVELDTTLLELCGADDPTHYIAVCGAVDLVRGFSVVQVPARDGTTAWSRDLLGQHVTAAVPGAGAERESPGRRSGEAVSTLAGVGDAVQARFDRAVAKGRAAERRVAELERQLSVARAEAGRRVADLEARTAASRADADALRARIDELEATAAEQDLALAQARDQLAERSAAGAPGHSAVPGDAADGRLTVAQLAAAVERLEDLERTLQAERDVAYELEVALRALRQGARNEADEGDADARARVRELVEELGSKEADIAVLEFGVEGLRGKLRELVASVKSARSDMNGQSASGMAEVMERLTHSLEPYAEA